MSSGDFEEQFVTLFDSHYLPQGLSLYRSLEKHSPSFHLWVVAMDEACAAALEKLGLPHMTILTLAEIEDDRLKLAKRDRSVGEYCWTLTPFLPSIVFDRAPGSVRVTYVDADVFFFQDPQILIDELVESGKHVLLTEHAFAPEYADRLRYGRFCVQFMTFMNTEAGNKVLRWWQDRCIEWCYAREEEGRFGDQKYLDVWPDLFREEVHVLVRTDRTLAPWNVEYTGNRLGAVHPVMYHFHSLKIVKPDRALLFIMYRIGKSNRWIYDGYVATLRAVAGEMRATGIPIVSRPMAREKLQDMRYVGRWLAGRMAWAHI
jgi:hypothetical protein